MGSKQLFYEAHRNLIIKAIEELSFEEILPIFEDNDFFRLVVNPHITYEFIGHIGVWNNLHIDSKTLNKKINGQSVSVFSANDFFIEVKEFCHLSDEILTQYIEEANQTIYSDIRLLELYRTLNPARVSELAFKEIEQLLPGHPKIIMNKGRIGWSVEDIIKFAPEFQPSFSLVWVAIQKSILNFGINKEIDMLDLYQESLTSEELNFITNRVNLEEYMIIPIHPWQWNRYIKVQFLDDIYSEKIIYLGNFGKKYTPQASIRTLSSKSNKDSFDIKLSLSILNTSCVRGISHKFIEEGYKISRFMKDLILDDKFLFQKIEILDEFAAACVKHRNFNNIEEAPYRFKEFLGVIWRESVQHKINENERAIPTAACFFKFNDQSYIKLIIKKSKVDVRVWVKKYFETVIIPLYHLQVLHGVGLVAHGQNTILVMEEYIPKRLIIKDFHGDLRLSNESIHNSNELVDILDKLPAEYLIHDLITGHFITVLRYFSRSLEEESLLGERDFYHILRGVLENYLNDHSKYLVSSKINLLRESFEKILVNKVRFVAGYSESATRLKPILGTEIINPILFEDEVVYDESSL